MRSGKSLLVYVGGMIIGSILIIIGLAGLVLPIIPGIVLIIVGVVLFSGGSVGGMLHKFKKKVKDGVRRKKKAKG